jgi:hypothetical protein
MLQDRYVVAKKSSAGEGRIHQSAVSVNNSTSGGSMESSDSSTTSGTSYETEDSEALEPDDIYDEEDFEELELMSIDTHPAMGGWVDSACGWLDRPMCLLNFGKETSLLRQSKGRTRAAAIQQMRMSEALSTVANMKLSASERRNLRLRRKGLHEQVQEDNDAATAKIADGEATEYDNQSAVDKKNKDVKLFSKKRIQPLKERAEETTALLRTSTGESTKRSMSATAEANEEQLLQGTGSNPTIRPVLSSKSHHSESAFEEEGEEQDRIHREEGKLQGKSDPEGSVHNMEGTLMKETLKVDGDESVEVDTEQEVRRDQEDRELSVTLDKVLMDSPNSMEPAVSSQSRAKRGGSLTVPSLELPESESMESTRQKEEEKQGEKTKNPSTRSERSLARKKRIMKVVQRSKSVPRKKETEAEITDLTHLDNLPTSPSPDMKPPPAENRHTIQDEAKYELPKDIEIIDVLSLDDQDSWTPGNARLHEAQSRGVTKKKKQQKSILERQQRMESKSRDPSPSLSRRFSNAQGRDPSPSENGREAKLYNPASTKVHDVDQRVASLWNEEAAKLSGEFSGRATTISGSKNLSVAKAADDLWSQEEQKLQTLQSDIFEDPMAREAFLGHRRGRLQAVGMESTHRSRSQSRRRRLAKVLQGADERAEESSHSRRSMRSTRSTRPSSLDLKRPPTPEVAVLPIKMTRSKSREAPGKSRLPSPQAAPPRQMQTESTTESMNHEDQTRVNPSTGLKKSKDLVVVRSIDDGQRLRIARSRGRDRLTYGSDSDGHENFPSKSGHSDSRSLERQNRSPKRRSKSREIEIVDLADVEDVVDHRPPLPGRDARDDRESKQVGRSLRRGSSSSPPAEEWPDYETVISATRELRKLEKKIEKQLRQVKRETKIQEWDNQAVSSKEIRKLEKQLAQKLKKENEKRATKLKRIRRKVHKTSSAVTADDDPVKTTAVAMPSASSNPQHQQEPQDIEEEYQSEKQQPHPMPDDMNESSPLSKSFSQKVDDFREKSKFDQMRVLRSSRYLQASPPHASRTTATPIDGNY